MFKKLYNGNLMSKVLPQNRQCEVKGNPSKWMLGPRRWRRRQVCVCRTVTRSKLRRYEGQHVHLLAYRTVCNAAKSGMRTVPGLGAPIGGHIANESARLRVNTPASFHNNGHEVLGLAMMCHLPHVLEYVMLYVCMWHKLSTGGVLENLSFWHKSFVSFVDSL